MAKRFGRNQRRRFRAELAHAEEAYGQMVKLNKAVTDELIEERHKLARWAAQVLAVAGPTSAFNRIPQVEIIENAAFDNLARRGLIELAARSNLSISRDRPTNVALSAQHVIEALVLELQCGNLRQGVHFALRSQNGDVALVIDSATLELFLRHRTRDEFALHLGQQFIAAMSAGMQGGDKPRNHL